MGERTGVEAAQVDVSPRAPDARPRDLLDPMAANALALQRMIGNRATARLLSRQTASDVDDLDKVIADFEHQRQAAFQALKARLTAKLTGGIADSMDFSNELRHLDVVDGARLLGDADFIAAVQSVFGRGEALWTVLLQLAFGNDKPLPVRELSLAVFEHDSVAVCNALRAYPMLTIERVTPGVRQVLSSVFAGDPALTQMLALLVSRETAMADLAFANTEVHYEASGFLDLGWTLKTFGGQGAYELQRAPGELRVIVSITLVEDESGLVTAAIEHRWRDGIQKAWNIGYRAVNDTTSLRIIFVPMFRYQEGGDHVVHVQKSVTDDREDESHWAVDTSGSTAAHEFGHMLGLSDEYHLPATLKEAMDAGLTREQAMNSSVEGIRIQEALAAGQKTYQVPQYERGGTDMPGMMSENQNVLPRHVRPIVQALNGNLLQKGEAKFHLEGPD